MLNLSPPQIIVLDNAIKTFGKENQLKKLVEELTELSLKIQHGIARGFDNSEVQEETSDVFICLQYAIKLFGLEECQQMVDFKINRLESCVQEFIK